MKKYKIIFSWYDTEETVYYDEVVKANTKAKALLKFAGKLKNVDKPHIVDIMEV